MAKQYIFTFSDSKGLIEPNKLTRSDVEKVILKNLFNIAAQQQKDIASYLECKDCISQIDNLKDGDSILFTENDIKYLKDGFEKTAGSNRPFAWLEHGEDIFRQMKNPIEKKE